MRRARLSALAILAATAPLALAAQPIDNRTLVDDVDEPDEAFFLSVPALLRAGDDGVWPRVAPDGRCSAPFPSGDWRMEGLDDNSDWWALRVMTEGPCRIQFDMAVRQADLRPNDRSFVLLVRLGPEPAQPARSLWVLQWSKGDLGTYLLLRSEPGDGPFRTFELLEQRCPPGDEVRESSWITITYCPVASRQALRSLAEAATHHPPVGRMRFAPAFTGEASGGAATRQLPPAVLGEETVASATPVMAFPGWVVDGAGVLDDATERRLTAQLTDLRRRTGHEVAVVTVPDLAGEGVEDWMRRTWAVWGVGRRGVDDGVMLMVAPNDRRVRLSVGDGLSAVLPDAWCQALLDDTLLPLFREGAYAGGVVAGVDAVLARLATSPGGRMAASE